MPTRLLREGLLTSDKINLLTAEEERFFTRLLLAVDDYGLCDGRPSILRSWCFPLKPEVSADDCERWLGALVKSGLVEVYEVDGKPYVHMFETRQRTRAQRSKYPMPTGLSTIDPQNGARGHMPDSCPSSAHGGGDGGGDGGGGGDDKAPRKARRSPGLPPLNPRPDWLPPEWEQYEAHRTAGKAAWTELAREKAVGKLSGYLADGYDLAAVINDSIANGWTGLFAKREHLKRGGKASGAGSRSRAAVEGFLKTGGQHASQ